MADFWKPTAELYSALFEKPKMSQKLLERPPFKYLFDIIMETIKKTGFKSTFRLGYGKGLYTGDELDGNSYDNKDKKLFFLQKIIDLTSQVLNEDIVANPIKIVTGQESENTNLLLQAIYRAAVSGKNSDMYVDYILAKIGAEPQPLLQLKQQHQTKIEQTQENHEFQIQIQELMKIIDKQRTQIEELQDKVTLKDTLISKLEQNILELKAQQSLNTN